MWIWAHWDIFLSIYGKFFVHDVVIRCITPAEYGRWQRLIGPLARSGAQVMGNTLHLHFFPLALSTCLPHRHLKLCVSPFRSFCSPSNLHPFWRPLFMRMASLSSQLSRPEQSIRHLWSVPLLAFLLIGLSDCVKSLFAPFLKSNPFHSYCRAPGGYLYVFCLRWLSWFLLCASNSAEEIDSGAVRQWFKVTFSHLPTGTENPVGIFFPFLPLFTSGMEMVIVCAL